MRLPRFLLAGLLLAGSVLLLTELLAREASGATAFAVFATVWLTLAVLNAGMGVFAAGYKPSEEALVLVPVFGVPTAVAGIAWWVWPNGPPLAGGRFLWFWAAGLALWASIALLAGLLIPHATRETALRTAAVVFLPIWLVLMTVNLLAAVLSQDYPLGEELAVLLLNAAVPAAVSVVASRLAQRG
ncbi:hypothetical protein OWR29_24360 [Actinoplanes sp. Pm04-4]|uniref:Uncharacterized protein n=1 Tax=Paractinoplanes pyxinae TaxID=2997416 RepID=A0ABT4B3R3_9ACTN|nr:hypothetical protein [Actinoplanes pyxinae]MCY1141144.1 hypothetical protein [Actinoplanes pyxinae]